MAFTRDKPTFMLNEAGRPSDSDVHKWNVERERYTGTVYCVSTPHQTIIGAAEGLPDVERQQPRLLLIVDEAGGISHTLGRSLCGMTSTEGLHMLAIGNSPTDDENSWFETWSARPAGSPPVRSQRFRRTTITPGPSPRPLNVVSIA